MPTKRAIRLWISNEMADILRNGHRKTNIVIGDKLKKKLSFIDYTEMVAKTARNDLIRPEMGFFEAKKQGKGRSRKNVVWGYDRNLRNL